MVNCDAGNYNMLSDTNTCGANDTTSKALTDYDFTDTTENSWDFHIASTSDAYNSGNDYSGSMTYDEDIDIATRTGTWDRGADEYLSLSVTPGPNVFGSMVVKSGGSGFIVK
jgi:hypothetical protein